MVTPVPSGHVLSETAGVRGRPLLVELKLNRDRRSGSYRKGLGQHRRGDDTNFGLQEGFAFFGSFDFGLPHCPARLVRSGDRHSVASTGGLPRVAEAADAACGPVFLKAAPA
ncbi:MAG TPA: hypothetical protein VLZ74_06565 [Methylocella sp.]|nr:hypothetical protein [Methylocella sp.]